MYRVTYRVLALELKVELLFLSCKPYCLPSFLHFLNPKFGHFLLLTKKKVATPFHSTLFKTPSKLQFADLLCWLACWLAPSLSAPSLPSLPPHTHLLVYVYINVSTYLFSPVNQLLWFQTNSLTSQLLH